MLVILNYFVDKRWSHPENRWRLFLLWHGGRCSQSSTWRRQLVLRGAFNKRAVPLRFNSDPRNSSWFSCHLRCGSVHQLLIVQCVGCFVTVTQVITFISDAYYFIGNLLNFLSQNIWFLNRHSQNFDYFYHSLK